MLDGLDSPFREPTGQRFHYRDFGYLALGIDLHIEKNGSFCFRKGRFVCKCRIRAIQTGRYRVPFLAGPRQTHRLLGFVFTPALPYPQDFSAQALWFRLWLSRVEQFYLLRSESESCFILSENLSVLQDFNAK